MLAPHTSSPRTKKRRTRGASRNTSRLRRVLPGATYHITKKTNDDFFYLRPSKELNLALLYTLVLKAVRYGILIHAFCFMSNHFHLVITDVQGKHPAFMREFLSESAKVLRFHVKSGRRIWSGDRFSAVHLLDLDAAERAIAYTILNPTRAGLTNPEEWPGLTSARHEPGSVIAADRPNYYFSKRYRPSSVSTILAPLPAHLAGQFPSASTCSPEPEGEDHALPKEQIATAGAELEQRFRMESKARIQNLVASTLREIRRERTKKKAPFLGAEKVLKASQYKRAIQPSSSLIPRFASTNGERMAGAILAERAFRAAHSAAKHLYIAMRDGPVFPLGTYGYAALLGVAVEGSAHPA